MSRIGLFVTNSFKDALALTISVQMDELKPGRPPNP